MTLQRLEQIESRVLNSAQLSEESRAELQREFAALKNELAAVTPAGAETAVASGEPEGVSDQPIVREFTDSVQEIEAAHPELTQVANRIAVILSNMGI